MVANKKQKWWTAGSPLICCNRIIAGALKKGRFPVGYPSLPSSLSSLPFSLSFSLFQDTGLYGRGRGRVGGMHGPPSRDEM